MLEFLKRWRKGGIRESKDAAIYIHLPSADIFSLHHWLPAGSAMDTIPGTAHALEHVLSGSTQHAVADDPAFGPRNAYTSFLWTRYDCKVTGAGLEKALDLIGRLRGPTQCTQKLFDIQKSIIGQEMHQQRLAAPHLEHCRRFDAKLFAGTFLQNQPLGTPDGLNRLVLADLEEFHGRFYSDAGVLTLVAGPAAPAAAERAIRAKWPSARFGCMAARPSWRDEEIRGFPPLLSFPGGAPEPRQFATDEDIASDLKTARVVFRTLVGLTCGGAEQLGAQKVLGALLSSRLPSSLHDELLEKSKLASEFVASADLVAPGLLMLSVEARASRDVAAEAVSERLTGYFTGLAENGIDRETFQRLVNRELGTLDNSAANHRDCLKMGEEILVGGFDAVADQKQTLGGMRVDDLHAILARLALPIRAGSLLLKPKGG
jgi:predicted Zn-dependent peptidase